MPDGRHVAHRASGDRTEHRARKHRDFRRAAPHGPGYGRRKVDENRADARTAQKSTKRHEEDDVRGRGRHRKTVQALGAEKSAHNPVKFITAMAENAGQLATEERICDTRDADERKHETEDTSRHFEHEQRHDGAPDPVRGGRGESDPIVHRVEVQREVTGCGDGKQAQRHVDNLHRTPGARSRWIQQKRKYAESPQAYAEEKPRVDRIEAENDDVEKHRCDGEHRHDHAPCPGQVTGIARAFLGTRSHNVVDAHLVFPLCCVTGTDRAPAAAGHGFSGHIGADRKR